MSKITDKQEVGDIGEKVVEKYVVQRGWNVLCKNFRKPFGEIDIVAKDKKSNIVFIEVKTQNRLRDEYFAPEMHFNKEKLRRLTKTCYSFLSENNITEDANYRIDLAAVNLNHKTRRARVRYYKNAAFFRF